MSIDFFHLAGRQTSRSTDSRKTDRRAGEEDQAGSLAFSVQYTADKNTNPGNSSPSSFLLIGIPVRAART